MILDLHHHPRTGIRCPCGHRGVARGKQFRCLHCEQHAEALPSGKVGTVHVTERFVFFDVEIGDEEPGWEAKR